MLVITFMFRRNIKEFNLFKDEYNDKTIFEIHIHCGKYQ